MKKRTFFTLTTSNPELLKNSDVAEYLEEMTWKIINSVPHFYHQQKEFEELLERIEK